MNRVRRHRLLTLVVTVALMALPAMNAPAPAAAEGEEYRLVQVIGGPADGRLNGPRGVAVDGAGRVYVADWSNAHIQVFDAQGNFLRKWGNRGSADGQFSFPHGVAVDGAGRVYVADTFNHRVQVFDAQGNFLGKWGSEGSADGQFNSPHGVAVDAAGRVYATDLFNLQMFNAQGNFLGKWGKGFGSGDGQFLTPLGVAVDGVGRVYVVDTSNDRIQVFDAQGNFLGKWGKGFGSADGQFAGPRGVAVDGAGRVYVADASNDRVQVFDVQGNFLGKWGSHGSADGQFSDPYGVAVDGAGRVYVADRANDRIQVFARSTAATPMAPPALNQPEEGSRLSALGTTLSWTLPSGATQYQLQATPANNDGPGVNLIGNATGSFTIGSPVLGQGNYVMLPGMTYTWRVRATSKASSAAEDDPSWGPWSPTRSFRTPAPSSAGISPVSPTDGATLAAASQRLQWANNSTDIFYYEVQVSLDPSFNTDPATATSFVWQNLVHGGVTSPLNSWTTPNLEPGATYFWRVRPRVQGDGTPVSWSATWRFATR